MENVEKRLETGLYGKPQLKPDEIKQYMGNFRERIYVSMTVKEMASAFYQQALQKRCEDGFEQEATLFLNANVGATLQSFYTKFAQKNELPLTIFTNEETLTPETLGIVIAANVAVNVETIEISKIYPDTKENAEPSSGIPKKSWFSHLFGTNNEKK